MDKKKITQAATAPVRKGVEIIKNKKEQAEEEKERLIENIPTGRASDSITPGCLIVEGGAFRGVYAGGVLDALMIHDMNFETTVGTSAGALYGYMYVSGQIGRGTRFNLRNRFNTEYVGLRAMIENRSIIGFDYAFDDRSDPDEPLDTERFDHSPRHFAAAATECETGRPVIFEKGKHEDMLQCLRASSSLPILSDPTVIDGKHYLDGGITAPIAIDWALQQGFEKIVVIRTRERTFRKPVLSESEQKVFSLRYAKYPELLERLNGMNDNYNDICHRLVDLEEDGRIFVISPSVNPQVSRLETDLGKLSQLYWLGFSDAEQRLERLKKYLNA